MCCCLGSKVAVENVLIESICSATPRVIGLISNTPTISKFLGVAYIKLSVYLKLHVILLQYSIKYIKTRIRTYFCADFSETERNPQWTLILAWCHTEILKLLRRFAAGSNREDEKHHKNPRTSQNFIWMETNVHQSKFLWYSLTMSYLYTIFLKQAASLSSTCD